MPKPRLSPRPRKKQVKRRFNPQWKVGRPWLHFENGAMSCLACRAYPQIGLQKVWLDGTPQVRKRAVVAHGNSPVHAVARALWESGGASATVIAGLPLPVRQAIFGLFHLVYRLVEGEGRRGKSFFVLGMSMMHGRYEKHTPMSGLLTFEADISC